MSIHMRFFMFSENDAKLSDEGPVGPKTLRYISKKHPFHRNNLWNFWSGADASGRWTPVHKNTTMLPSLEAPELKQKRTKTKIALLGCFFDVRPNFTE